MLPEPLRSLLRAARAPRNDRMLRSAALQADAFLISFPKCGRTWLRFALSQYFARTLALPLEPDLQTTFQVLPNFDRDPVRGLPAFRFSGRRPALPLILVSHRGYNRHWFQDRPVVFLVRDPRDVVVSAFFHATRHKHRFSGTIGDFIEDDAQGLGSYIAYLNGWAAGLANARCHVTSYERMSADPATELRRILLFLGQLPDEQALAHAVETSSFGAMRNKEQKTGIPGHRYDLRDRESLRMRRGKPGGFTDYLSPAEIERVAERCRTGLTPAGLALMTDYPLAPEPAETPVAPLAATA